MKKIIFDKSALEVIRGFSVEVRQELGALLMLLQQGEQLGMPQSRPLMQLARSAFELRLKDRDGIYRVFYVMFDKDQLIVPHAFTKKTQKTPLQEIETGKRNLRRLINEIE